MPVHMSTLGIRAQGNFPRPLTRDPCLYVVFPQSGWEVCPSVPLEAPPPPTPLACTMGSLLPVGTILGVPNAQGPKQLSTAPLQWCPGIISSPEPL